MDNFEHLQKKQESWDRFYLFMAINYMTASKDPSTTIGAVIVNTDNIPVGWGYNGMSKEMDSEVEEELMDDRSTKYPRVIHAEENAIFNSVSSLKGGTVYVTHPTCVGCLHKLSQVGVKRAVFVEPSEDFSGRWDLEAIKEEAKHVKIELRIYGRDTVKGNFAVRSTQALMNF